MIDIRIIVLIKLALLVVFLVALVPAFGQPAVLPPPTHIIVPIDVVALVQAVFTGIAALGGVFATVYAIMAKIKTDNVALAQIELNKALMLIERNTNSMTSTIKELATKAGIVEGAAREKTTGQETAATLAEGRKLGKEEERASMVASGVVTNATLAVAAGKQPVPVADDRTAAASERVADATERSADAQQRVANIKEEEKK